MSRVPAVEIFAALASELHRAGELCERLETVVTRLVRADGLASPDGAVREVQAVDALAQHLRGLANFAEALAVREGSAGGHEVSAALKTITLAALAARLAAQTGHAAAAHAAGHEEGELQLF